MHNDLVGKISDCSGRPAAGEPTHKLPGSGRAQTKGSTNRRRSACGKRASKHPQVDHAFGGFNIRSLAPEAMALAASGLVTNHKLTNLCQRGSRNGPCFDFLLAKPSTTASCQLGHVSRPFSLVTQEWYHGATRCDKVPQGHGVANVTHDFTSRLPKPTKDFTHLAAYLRLTGIRPEGPFRRQRGRALGARSRQNQSGSWSTNILVEQSQNEAFRKRLELRLWWEMRSRPYLEPTEKQIREIRRRSAVVNRRHASKGCLRWQ